MKIPKHIQFSLDGCHSDNEGIAWEHFGGVYEWAKEEAWWQGFLNKHGRINFILLGGPAEALIQTSMINPPRFADAIIAFLKEVE